MFAIIKQRVSCALMIAGMIGITACQGSSTSGSATSSSDTRALTGSVSSAETTNSNSSFLQNDSSLDCEADQILATDSTGESLSTDVDANCDFSISLILGKSYNISFLKNSEFIASLIFSRRLNGDTTSTIPVSEGTGAIDLGSIIFSGNVASPEQNPLHHCDFDGDGISDYDDDDDDGDGTYDDNESDCDLDGFDDDFDLSSDDSCLPGGGNSSLGGLILRVKPFDGAPDVDLDKDVRIDVGCRLDRTTVTNDTVIVMDADLNQMTCDLRVEPEHFHDKIVCRHRDEPFTANTTYTVTLDGLYCDDDTQIETVSWNFSTELQDDDDGDLEDELNDDSSDDSDDESIDDSEDDSDDEEDNSSDD